jgi:putative membrane protein
MNHPAAAVLPKRLHWSSMLSTLGSSARSAWGLVAGGAYFAASGQWYLVLGFILVSLTFSLGAAFVRWRRFTYRIEGDGIRVDSGVMNRKHRSIPFDRIQDVEITQGPIARVLQVAKVKLETGASTGDKDEGLLQAVQLEEAEALRLLVRARRGGSTSAVTAESTVAEELQSPPIFAMGPKRLLLSGIFNFSLALLAALAGASKTFGDMFGVDPFERSFWRQVEAASGPFTQLLRAHQLAASLAGLLLLIVVGLLTGIVRTILRDYGFRLDRSEAGLRRRRGLLTKSDVTLQVRRVQAAVVGMGPVRAAFGWRDLKVQSLAQDEGGASDHIVAPLVTAAETDALLEELRFAPLSPISSWQRVSIAYLLTFLLATAPFYLVALGQAVRSPWLGISFAGVLAAAQAGRWMAWRHTAFARDGDRVLIRRGWWRRRIYALPARNIQTIEISESFLSRWFGTATLTFGVAGGTGHMIPALPSERARQLRSELLSLAA